MRSRRREEETNSFNERGFRLCCNEETKLNVKRGTCKSQVHAFATLCGPCAFAFLTSHLVLLRRLCCDMHARVCACYMCHQQVNPVERAVGHSPPLIESPHVLKADLVTYQYYKVGSDLWACVLSLHVEGQLQSCRCSEAGAVNILERNIFFNEYTTKAL